MKKIIVIFTILATSIALGGCQLKDSIKTPSNDSQANPGVQIVTYTQPKTIVEAVENLEDNTSIISITAVEPTGLQMQTTFTQPYNSVEPILQEYNEARLEHLNLLLDSNKRDRTQIEHLNPEGFDGYLENLGTEKEDLDSLLQTDTHETLLVNQITVIINN